MKCVAAGNLRVLVDTLEDFFQPILIVLPQKAVHLVNDQIPQVSYGNRPVVDMSNQPSGSSDQDVDRTISSLDATQAHAVRREHHLHQVSVIFGDQGAGCLAVIVVTLAKDELVRLNRGGNKALFFIGDRGLPPPG